MPRERERSEKPETTIVTADAKAGMFKASQSIKIG
jgi:hypothetical protein